MATKVRARKPTPEEIEAGLRVHQIDAQVRMTQTIVPWLGWVVLALFGWLSIHDLAGKITKADISVLAKAVFGEEGSPMCPAWYVVAVFILFGLASMRLAWKERKQRKDTVEHLHPYQKLWETEHDQSRKSSKLTLRGDTRPEDK